MVKEYKARSGEVKKELADEDLSTDKYLEEVESLAKRNILIFQFLTEQFYRDKIFDITIESNPGTNRLRFDIEARVMDDTEGGMNETRTSCSDWTLLGGQYSHSVKFILYSSRLVSEGDPHQVAMMLKITQKRRAKDNLRYILSVSQSTLDLLAKELLGEKYKTLIVDTEVLGLSDISDANELLGTQPDLNCTKE